MSGRFTAVEKRDAAIREANMRRSVYPRRIEANKMRQSAADREIAIMEDIAADYKILADAEMMRRAQDEGRAKERWLFG